MPTLASRRAKRPAPGPVTSSQEGGNAISVGKRARRPGKKLAAAAKKVQEGTIKEEKEEVLVEEEEIDPNEPRYCVCGDVSYGTMVQCEDPEVSSLSSCRVW